MRKLIALSLMALLSGAPLLHASATPVAGVDYAGLVEKNKATVVFVSVKEKPTDEKDDEEKVGQGSGFILDGQKGYILTNAHVVKDSLEVSVTLENKQRYRAKVVGYDTRTDVAVLHIPASNLPAVSIGNPAALRVGDPVAAVGAPYGLDMTVTAGIVSAKHRNLGGQFVPFLQTDAAVNPGNSGGPLFNAQGEVVGINSQIYSRSGSFAGLSFAIPIDIAVDVANSLIKQGKVTRGKIGVMLQPVTEDLAEPFGMHQEAGALITKVDAGSPAEKAGLQIGDIILKADDVKVVNSVELPRYVSSVTPGKTIVFDVWRERHRQTIVCSVVPLTEEAPVVKSAAPTTAEQKLGLSLRPLNPAELVSFGVKQGLMLEGVKDKSPAEKAGLKAGDVLLVEHSRPLVKVEDFRAALKDPSVPVLVLRKDGRAFITLDTQASPH